MAFNKRLQRQRAAAYAAERTDVSITTVQQAFEEYEQKSRVPADQAARARDVHPEVRQAVENDLGDLFNRAFLAGSYARKVQTAPRLKDVDIIFVLNDPEGKFAGSAQVALERLRRAAKTCELVDSPTRMGCRAVKLPIVSEEFTVDAVAALEDGFGGLKLARFIPDDGHDDWTAANPKGQMDAHWQKNKQTDGMFIPAVRIIRTWNNRTLYKGKHCLPSYLVESILFHALWQKVDFDQAMLAFFQQAERHLSTSTPSVLCPGDSGSYVDERLDDDRRDAALEKVREALSHARDAIAETDAREAMNCWAKVFGPAFPAPAGDTSSLAEALKSGTARASGAGITTSSQSGRQVIRSRSWRIA